MEQTIIPSEKCKKSTIIPSKKCDLDKCMAVEVLGWYDGIAYYEDEQGNRISRNGNPMEKDELCTPGWICKVEQVGEYDYKVLSKRKDGVELPLSRSR